MSESLRLANEFMRQDETLDYWAKMKGLDDEMVKKIIEHIAKHEVDTEGVA